MSIADLKELKDWAKPRTHQYYDNCRTYDTGDAGIYKILDLLIPVLEKQLDQIIDLQKQLDQKEERR